MKTIWLASYPKSGNTWFRMLIANLNRDTPVDINDLPQRHGIASARGRFDNIMLFSSALLTHDECDRLRPRVYQEMAKQEVTDDTADEQDTEVGDVRFIKVHDAYTYTDRGEPLLGGSAAAAGAILIVRDPRDVASSFANHSGRTVDQSIATMASLDSAFCETTYRQHNQLRQQLRGWSLYHESWVAQDDIPLHVIRYEDMKSDTVTTLCAALDFAGIPTTRADATRAARFADFEELKRQEDSVGFREKPRPSAGSSFFRRGISGGWRDELTAEQVARIEIDHAAMMARFGYATTHGANRGNERMAG